MNSKRFITVAICLIIVLVVIASTGCAKNTGTPGQNKNNGNLMAEGEKVELTFGHFRVTQDGIDRLFIDFLEKFRAEHSDITIKEEAVAHDPYREKMTTLGASGQLPDIFMANGSMIIDLASKGYVAEWDDQIANDTSWSGAFVKGAFDDFKVNGKTYGVPVKMAAVHTVYYNKEIFKEVGITEFPQTWDSFKDAITKLNDAGYTPIGMGNRSNVPVGSTLFSTLADRVTGTDWFNGLATGESKFTDPEFIQALETMKELVDLKAFNPDINSIDEGQGESLFYNRNAAMHISGSWFLPRLVQEAPEEIVANTGIAFLPAIAGGKGEARAAAGGGGWSYAINSNLTGAKKEAAIEVVKALSGIEFAKSQVELNELPAVTVTEYDESKLHPLAIAYNELLNGVTYTPVYDIRMKPALVESVYQGVQELLIGVSTPQQIAERVQSIVE